MEIVCQVLRRTKQRISNESRRQMHHSVVTEFLPLSQCSCEDSSCHQHEAAPLNSTIGQWIDRKRGKVSTTLVENPASSSFPSRAQTDPYARKDSGFHKLVMFVKIRTHPQCSLRVEPVSRTTRNSVVYTEELRNMLLECHQGRSMKLSSRSHLCHPSCDKSI